jgi:predicted dehydrogenase
MANKLRVGVIGTSVWADDLHLRGLANYPRAELVALCGRNRERAQELASKYNIPRVFTAYEEMIARANLDALLILAPDDLHYPMTMCALDAGLHVMCEKPLALNARDARAMYDKAEQVGVKHGVFFTSRWLPPELYLAELLRDGYIGSPFHCDLHFLGDCGMSELYQWRFDGKRSNGVVADLGTHMVDLMRWHVGEIESVSCQSATFVGRQSADDTPLVPASDSASMLVQFANGAQGSIYLSAIAHLAERHLQYQYTFHGDAGTLEANLTLAGTELRGARAGEPFRALEIPDRWLGESELHDRFGAFTKNISGDRAFIDAILDDKPFMPNFYDGWKAQQVIDAALESARTGCRVSVV